MIVLQIASEIIRYLFYGDFYVIIIAMVILMLSHSYLRFLSNNNAKYIIMSSCFFINVHLQWQVFKYMLVYFFRNIRKDDSNLSICFFFV